METKFQSSFIPKGPAVSTGVPVGNIPSRTGDKSLFSFIASVIFTISLILALGVFGYKFYLRYSIGQMEGDLESVYTSLDPDALREIIRLDQRITSTKNLISSHMVVSPIFEFLQNNTPRTVRFTEFRFDSGEQGNEVSMRGEALGYADIALVSDVFKNSGHFRNTVFSDFNLADSGTVAFSVKANVNPNALSYEGRVRAEEVVSVPEPTLPLVEVETAATSSATSSATSTVPTGAN